MIKNYFKIAWRNLINNKAASLINVGGLTIGMAVATLIGLWIWDELSFDKYHQGYDRIAQVMQKQTVNGTIATGVAIPLPLDAEMHKNYSGDFKHIVIASWIDGHILTVGDKKIAFPGNFMSAEGPEMFTLKMLKGARNGLKDPSSILISQSVSKALFGDIDPMGKTIKLDDKASFGVSGVYEDLPDNTTLHDLAFTAPWDYFATQDWVKSALAKWNDNSFRMYVQIADQADMAKLSEKNKNVKLNNADPGDAKLKPIIFLQPMSKWHLYAEFKNGVNIGGAIEYVWLFGIIGVFVLLLACINFMNLSTARSEKRAKEVGIRKAVGSLRGQLIIQFFCESLLMTIIAFAVSLLLILIALPFFNEIANKKISILWANPLFWLMSVGFTLFTGILAGSYPALYLSSFNPVKVLKGTFKTGKFAALPRKMLVVTQFTVSIVLIIGTVVIFKQVQFAKNRPVGYSREGLVTIGTNDDLHKNFNAVRADLLQSGSVMEAAESSSPTTGVNNFRHGLIWKGKDPAMTDEFALIRVTTEYGKTVGWQFKNGRDFSKQFLTDSSGVIINEAAVKYMGLKNPVGETIRFANKNHAVVTDHTVIGVIKDMVMQSPYEPVKQTVFYMSNVDFNNLIIKLNPQVSTHEAISKIAGVYKAYSPAAPFSYNFADEEYGKKFADEERIGKLASCFSILAIFISCIGLFGMASYLAAQRKKEIGIRKVLGASVLGLWGLLSVDFVKLVIISLVISMPIAYYFMQGWLRHYIYHAELSWWIFGATATGAILITLLTVSYQSVKAALTNPIESLKIE